MDLHDGTPFWPRRNGILAVHPPLAADLRCDVVVVGAGITGGLIALELTRRGLDVIVLDRRDVAGGSTSASTSMLQYEIDELLVDLTDALGWEAAATAYRACNRRHRPRRTGHPGGRPQLRLSSLPERVHGGATA
jgi:NADPH-dependent 2,4-dienoyl-CoA reductase/sulfur reductase-like enzyme